MRLSDVVVDPRPVAVLRMALGVATVMNVFEATDLLLGIADGALARPMVAWVPGPSTPVVLAYLLVGTVAGLGLTLGVRTTAMALTCGLMNVAVLVWDEQTYSNHRVLATLLVLFLAFARSDHAWSLSARGRAATAVPWWPQLLVMAQVSVVYWFAALSKLNPLFISGDGLRDWVWWPLPDWVFAPMAIATVLTELFLAVGLWFWRTRWVAALLGLGLHLSIVTMLDDPAPLLAFALECVPVYLLFLWRPRSFPAAQVPEDPQSQHTGPLELGAPHG